MHLKSPFQPPCPHLLGGEDRTDPGRLRIELQKAMYWEHVSSAGSSLDKLDYKPTAHPAAPRHTACGIQSSMNQCLSLKEKSGMGRIQKENLQ